MLVFPKRIGLLPQGLTPARILIADGQNEYHAILGNSGPAYFVHPSSLAPALIALDAKIQNLWLLGLARGECRASFS